MLLDELNLAGQSVLEGLNALLDHRAEVFIPELGQTFRWGAAAAAAAAAAARSSPVEPAFALLGRSSTTRVYQASACHQH